MSTLSTHATMAVFLDLENIALGVRDARYPNFDIEKVIERLLLKGHIVVKKAYCDYDRYREYKRGLHEAAFELIEIPHLRQSGKNSADIRMVVDALDLCYTKGHLDTFVIISGDSDFSPLVSKLRENAKKVVGVGVKNSTSDLFLKNCDEFLYYDDLVRPSPIKKSLPRPPAAAPRPTARTEPARSDARTEGKPESRPGPETRPDAAPRSDTSKAEPPKVEPKRLDPLRALDMVVETLEALTEEREEDERIWGSMIKDAIKRRNPGFNERAFGFRTFSDLLIEAENRGLLRLEPADDRSRGYSVRTVDPDPASRASPPPKS